MGKDTAHAMIGARVAVGHISTAKTMSGQCQRYREYDQSPIFVIDVAEKIREVAIVAFVPERRRSIVPTTGKSVHELGKGVLSEMSQSEASSAASPIPPKTNMS